MDCSLGDVQKSEDRGRKQISAAGYPELGTISRNEEAGSKASATLDAGPAISDISTNEADFPDRH
jgi:hypothetical protein